MCASCLSRCAGAFTVTLSVSSPRHQPREGVPIAHIVPTGVAWHRGDRMMPLHDAHVETDLRASAGKTVASVSSYSSVPMVVFESSSDPRRPPAECFSNAAPRIVSTRAMNSPAFQTYCPLAMYSSAGGAVGLLHEAMRLPHHEVGRMARDRPHLDVPVPCRGVLGGDTDSDDGSTLLRPLPPLTRPLRAALPGASPHGQHGNSPSSRLGRDARDARRQAPTRGRFPALPARPRSACLVPAAPAAPPPGHEHCSRR